MRRKPVPHRFTNHGASSATHVIKPGTREARAQAYFRELADKMGLKDWDIQFLPDEEPDTEEADASIGYTENQHAKVKVHPRFWGHPSTFQRLIAIHELAHLPCSLFDGVAEMIMKAVPAPAGGVIKMAMEQAEEHAVESFARLLAPKMPLPPKF